MKDIFLICSRKLLMHLIKIITEFGRKRHVSLCVDTEPSFVCFRFGQVIKDNVPITRKCSEFQKEQPLIVAAEILVSESRESSHSLKNCINRHCWTGQEGTSQRPLLEQPKLRTPGRPAQLNSPQPWEWYLGMFFVGEYCRLWTADLVVYKRVFFREGGRAVPGEGCCFLNKVSFCGHQTY